ncbi:hypothetical protein JOC47_003096 [Halanaerobacter jeridensis]|uniref:Uncharacterized protein n=1 Tax=Halanaerobacter jeridensis TaxID=706427 RepID=A0A938XUV4_9FIRM|nr:hypothetical protein [Halanaerobacter jeridensis]
MRRREAAGRYVTFLLIILSLGVNIVIWKGVKNVFVF